MNAEQQVILWVGLILTLVYLFTDKSFHQALTTTSSSPGVVLDANIQTSSSAAQTSTSAQTAGAQLL